VKLLYFAWVRQRVGRAEEDIAAPASVTTVASLIDFLRKRGPGYEAAFQDLKLLRCAINQVHANFDAKLKPDDEVAFFPPVTGGTP
jgi:molybdopterin synthase sulfur carrier subunit